MTEDTKRGTEGKKIGYANESFYYAFSGERSTIIQAELTLAEEVQPEALREALRAALKRYPNFRQTLVAEGNRLFYAPHEGEPLLGPEDGRQLYLATAETNGYLFRVFYRGETLTICVHHGLTDGRGMFEFSKTLLYYYAKALGRSVDAQGMVLTNDDPDDPAEQEDSFARYGDPQARPLGLYQNHGGLQIREALFGAEQPYCRRFRVRCSMQALLQLARRSGVTPVPVLSILISQVLRRLYAAGDEPVTGYIPVNLRPRYRAKALNNFSLAVTLPYQARTQRLPWDVQATIQRGILDLQAQKENFDYKIARMCAAGEQTAQLPMTAAQKQELLAARLQKSSREQYSYLLTYIGALELPEDLRALVRGAEVFIPAFLIPFTVCAVALDGQLTLTCMQDFEGDQVVRGLCELLREQGIAASYEDMGVFRPDKLVLGKLG